VLIEDLASHGWIVAAIDHTYNAAVRFPDGRVLGNLPRVEQGWPELNMDANEERDAGLTEQERRNEIEKKRQSERERMTHWARDMSFVIDQLTILDKSGPFARRLDLENGVGVFGHSLGGIAAGTARLLDSRVAGSINLDGWGFDGAFAESKGPDMGASPFLWILRKNDTKYPDRRELQPITGGALRVMLNRPQFTHGDFTDEGYWDIKVSKALRIARLKGLGDAREWIRTFFDATIRGDKRGLQRMAARKGNVSPNTVVVFGPILVPH